MLLGAASRRQHVHAGARCSCFWRRAVGACPATAEEWPRPLAFSQCRAFIAPGEPAWRINERRRRRRRDPVAAAACEVRKFRGSALQAGWLKPGSTDLASRRRGTSRATHTFAPSFRARKRRTLTLRWLRFHLPRYMRHCLVSIPSVDGFPAISQASAQPARFSAATLLAAIGSTRRAVHTERKA